VTIPPPPIPTYQESAIREWERLMRQIGALAEAAVDATSRPDRIWRENDLEQLITNTDLGAIVGDSSYTREGALAAREFVLAFMTWAETPITVATLPNGDLVQMTPMQIISKR